MSFLCFQPFFGVHKQTEKKKAIRYILFKISDSFEVEVFTKKKWLLISLKIRKV